MTTTHPSAAPARTQTHDGPTPDKVMQLITGGWASTILGAGARLGLFDALEQGAQDAKTVAQKANVSERGAQALLDGLTGLGLLTLKDGRYANTPEAKQFLLKGKPSYLGNFAEVIFSSLPDWTTLADAVKSGRPTAQHTAFEPDNAFWHVLVPAIAPLSFPIAQMLADKLGLAKKGEVRWLDVGGGSGVWSAAWLLANKQARATQLDWPHVNAIAKKWVGQFGVADRFETKDGDFHATDFGAAQYDYAIYSHIAHQEAPSDNVAVFTKLKKALKPGGTLLVSDFVLSNERTGHPFAMMFSSQMLLVSKGGAAWRRADYEKWLKDAGFASVEFVPTPGPATVVLAK